MNYYSNKILLWILLIAASITFGCSAKITGSTGKQIKELRYLGEYIIAHNTQFKNTTVGGLSGIDYDKENDLFYIISDDWSLTNPARFYTAKLFLNNKIDSVKFLDVHYVLQQDGSFYPNAKQNPYRTPDPEAIRYHPLSKTIAWNSEGERFIMGDSIVLQDPAIRIINKEGQQLDSFPLPVQVHMYKEEKGLRRNGTLEGLSFGDGYKTLYASIEEPLYEDGHRAGRGDSTAVIRIIKYDVESKKPIGQYAYQVDAVVRDPVPANGFRINGVSEILEISKNKLLIVERSYSLGRTDCNIRIYAADISGATNIAGLTSLKNAKYNPVKKKLLFNMDWLGMYISNIEGVSFGPQLPNGNETLIFVADNNFRATEKTQFLLFEIIK
jgi:hypothetical protein